MARVAKSSLLKPATTAPDPAERDLTDRMIDHIMSTIDREHLVLSSPRSFQASVQREDLSYRTKSIEPDRDFSFEGIRVGVRKGLIFLFKPIEPAEYIMMELNQDAAFGLYPELEPVLVDALGFSVATDRPSFNEAKIAWTNKARAARNKERREREKALQAEKEAEEKKLIAENESNPAWGSW